MTIGVLKEPAFENRVSLFPEHIAQLKKMNVSVCVESGAGIRSFISDEVYEQCGASLVNREEVIRKSDLILSINRPPDELPQGKILLGVFLPLYHPQEIKQLASQGLTVFSMDMLPRTTRAQSMDVLSSQANIAGYKAVLIAANQFPRYFPMFMTSAGTVPPAKMLILGAGVAGLQAIATARRLGAVVEVFDTRPAVKEEVQSLGAKFVEVEGAADASKAGGYAVEQTDEYRQKQQQRIAEAVAKADVVVTTAQIPGKKAPILITNVMLESMKHGSVIVDIAASSGGNTEQTKDNKTITYNGVTIIGNSELPGTMPADASRLYGKNILNFLKLIIDKDGNVALNFEDDLVKGACISHNGNITNERIAALT
ncbi:MAG: Re/Si-specific NAD(P)(+) transhydrogenase subunit alpha [Chitinophagaceae bacterium]|nr:Re/Si-specific NAD(P)(+) transhydrogenase subunit alpha [Bacteroidota bacterium]MCC6258677.1 Re/Si-specific NAD(P)(+) transhydrogenase subunit alpha [Chitinophagaceae bacterium]MCW5916997.1 Re/Si-specific NAD(P)(+) transhydrogenase subunit alpha [Ferruginibacter sp.]